MNFLLLVLGLGATGAQQPTHDSGDGNAAAAEAGSRSDDAVLRIGNSTQLFADDFIVSSMTSTMTRSMHSPVMTLSDAAIQADQPWEQGYKVSDCAVSVAHVPNVDVPSGLGKIRVWYGLRTVAGAAERGVLLAYAESMDGGRSFTKPLLNQYSLGNSTANNIIMPVPTTSHCMAVFVDPNEPIGSPQRYRGISANTALISPDGLRWTKTGVYNVPSMLPGVAHNPFDTQDQIIWDPRCSCYSLYARWENERDNSSGEKTPGLFSFSLESSVSTGLKPKIDHFKTGSGQMQC
jgi:hypothetical protein